MPRSDNMSRATAKRGRPGRCQRCQPKASKFRPNLADALLNWADISPSLAKMRFHIWHNHGPFCRIRLDMGESDDSGPNVAEHRATSQEIMRASFRNNHWATHSANAKAPQRRQAPTHGASKSCLGANLENLPTATATTVGPSPDHCAQLDPKQVVQRQPRLVGEDTAPRAAGARSVGLGHVWGGQLWESSIGDRSVGFCDHGSRV